MRLSFFSRVPVLSIAGACLNIIVMYKNGGKMPVRTKYLGETGKKYLASSSLHVKMAEDTKCKILGDIIPIRNYVYSIGDILMLVSLGLVTASLIEETLRPNAG